MGIPGTLDRLALHLLHLRQPALSSDLSFFVIPHLLTFNRLHC